MEQPKQLFCTKQFKPVIALIVLLAAVVVGWTAFRQKGSANPPGLGLMGPPGSRVATAPPIKAGQPAPHPDWGTCTDCHKITGPGKPVAFMPAATAPPIRAGQRAPHPDWGPCTRCHNVTPSPGTGARKAAFTGVASVAPPLGIWIRPITPALADRLGLDTTDGVLVSGVHDPSPAGQAGLKVGDVIRRIDNRKVESTNEALAMIAEAVPNDTVKLQILRDGRSRKIFVTISDTQNNTAGAPVTQVALPAGAAAQQVAPGPIPGRIAVAATGRNLSAQVARSFGSAATFILYDTTKRQYYFLDNPGAQTLSAGQQAASSLSGARVTTVIAGNIGPASMSRLRSSGIQTYTGAFGSVQSVVQRYLQGRLVPAASSVTRAAAAPAATVPAGKLALASTGSTLNSQVSADLGMAPYLILYDPATGQTQAIAKDPAVDPGISATQIAHLLVDRGATAVIAGNISPAAVQTLSQLGIFPFAGVAGSVTQAIQLYNRGGLQASTAMTKVPPAARGQGMTL